MCRFYSWTIGELRSLSIDDADRFWDCISIIEAQEHLARLSVMDWPHLKNTEREKQHRSLHLKAFPDSFNGARQVSHGDLAAFLSGG
jgi:hypothetical protein